MTTLPQGSLRLPNAETENHVVSWSTTGRQGAHWASVSYTYELECNADMLWEKHIAEIKTIAMPPSATGQVLLLLKATMSEAAVSARTVSDWRYFLGQWHCCSSHNVKHHAKNAGNVLLGSPSTYTLHATGEATSSQSWYVAPVKSSLVGRLIT